MVLTPILLRVLSTIAAARSFSEEVIKAKCQEYLTVLLKGLQLTIVAVAV